MDVGQCVKLWSFYGPTWAGMALVKGQTQASCDTNEIHFEIMFTTNKSKRNVFHKILDLFCGYLHMCGLQVLNFSEYLEYNFSQYEEYQGVSKTTFLYCNSIMQF